MEKPEVKLIVLMWKINEYEELEKVFGKDILEFPKYVASYVRAVVFPDEKWIEKRGEAGLRIVFPIMPSEEEGELEEWVYGVVEKAIPRGMAYQVAPKEEWRKAYEEGRFIKIHPLEHKEAFLTYLDLLKYYRRKINKIGKLLDKMKCVIGR